MSLCIMSYNLYHNLDRKSNLSFIIVSLVSAVSAPLTTYNAAWTMNQQPTPVNYKLYYNIDRKNG